MSGSYTRTMGAQKPQRDSNIPRFHMEAVADEIASAKAGRPIFAQQERVQIIMPGSPHSPTFLVTDEYRQRWPEEYEAFRRGEESQPDGTPLEQWPFLKKNHVFELKAIGIFTIEQCAELSDLACQRIGMGGRQIRENAKAYLSDAEATRIVSQAIADREIAESRVADLENKVAQMGAMLERIQTENMTMRNAPSPVDTYVPGMHDPVQMGALLAPEGPIATSSLDSLPARRPRQSRPETTA